MSPRMTAALSRELQILAARVASNEGFFSMSIREKIAALGAETGFSVPFIFANVRLRASEILRVDASVLGTRGAVSNG